MTKLCTTNWFYIFATSESHNFSKWHRYSRNSLPHEPVRPSRDHSFFKNLKFPCGMFPLYIVQSKAWYEWIQIRVFINPSGQPTVLLSPHVS